MSAVPSSPDHRLLLVHAHPDDETITTGATMACYAAAGASVTLITCTRGEQGEIIPPELAHLTTGADGTLGPCREAELAAAMQALGVRDHRFLGASTGQRFVDSGMALDHEGVVIPSPDVPAGAFTAITQDAAEQAQAQAVVLAGVLREVRPQVVVTYDPGGGYGHPDHVRASLITMLAVELSALTGPAGEPAWPVPKVYWIVRPLSLARAELARMALLPGRPSSLDEASLDAASLGADGRRHSMVVPDEQVTTAIDASAFIPAKVAALRAHATQIWVTPDDACFCLSNGLFQQITGLECFRLVRGQVAGPFDDLGRETSLFAGVAP